MECLNSLIGIKNLTGGDIAGDSGMVVNDQFITIRKAAAVMNNENLSPKEFIQGCINEAALEVKELFKTHLLAGRVGYSVLENNQVGYFRQDLRQQSAQSDYLTGIKLKVKRNEYLDIFLSQIRLQMQSTGTVTVEVWDLTSGVRLDTINCSATANVPTSTRVSKIYKTEGQVLNLFIGYDASAASIQTEVGQSALCCGQTVKANRHCEYGGFKILKSADKIESNLLSQNGTSGLNITYSLNCNHDGYICKNRDALTYGILQKARAKIVMAQRFSDRLNSFVIVGVENTETLLQWYEEQATNSLNQVFNSIAKNVPQNACFSCRSAVRMMPNP